MTLWMFFGVLALLFIAAWVYLAGNPGKRARLGPDGTNVREPETFVVHHEGKGQGLDIANTALKARTEELRSELPGDADKIKTPVPGRDMVRMDAPPSDRSRFGDEKVAPGAEPKEKVLTEGPIGSRPGTPEEPGSPYAKGRRVTDNHRDIELAAELLPNVFPGHEHRLTHEMAASPSTNGQEPGYGLGQTGPGESDGEGGEDEDYEVEQPEATDEVPDIPDGAMPTMSSARGRVVPLRYGKAGKPAFTFQPDGDSMGGVEFQPDDAWVHEHAEELGWPGLNDEIPLPQQYGEDTVTALVRNPFSLYVYWDRSGRGDENVAELLGGMYSEPVLRVYDLDSGAHPGQNGGHVQVIRVGEMADHWFINEGLEPGRRYIVSYERETTSGQHYLLSQSAPVKMPDAGARPQGFSSWR